jgi:hypothetical protein
MTGGDAYLTRGNLKMIKSRKALGAVAVGLMGAGVLGACAPAAPPTTTVPGVGNSDTKNVDMTCNLNIFDNGALLFPSVADYAVTLTLAADDVAAGATTTVTATVAGITNGPLPGAGGYIQANVGGGLTDAADLAAGLANDPIVADPIVFESDPINGETQIQITGFEFHADGLGSSVVDPNAVGHAHDLSGTSVDDWSDGVCTLDAGEEPTITVGNI